MPEMDIAYQLERVEERIHAFEKFVGESMVSRLESLEALYAKDVGFAMQKLGDLDKTIANFAIHDQLASVEERVNSLEKLMAESDDSLKKVQFAHGDCLDSLEVVPCIGDNAERYVEAEVAKEKLGDLEMVDVAKHDQLESIEERMHSFDSMLTSLEPQEFFIGDDADTYPKDVGFAKEKLTDLGIEDLDKVVLDVAKHDQLASVVERTNCLEKLVACSADTQKKPQFEKFVLEKLVAYSATKQANNQTAQSMKSRLESLEALIGETTEKYAKDVGIAEEKLRNVFTAIGDCAKHDQLASVEERLNSLGNSVAESADTLKRNQFAYGEHSESMKIRLESLEALMACIGDNAEKCAKELEAAKEKLGDDLDKAITNCANHGQLASVEERLNSLENSVAESADTLEKNQFAYGEHRESMQIRLESFEALMACIGDNAEKYAKELVDAQEKLGNLDKAVADCAKHDQLTSVEERLNSLENSVAESADTWKKHQFAYGEHRASMKIRLESLGDNAEKYARELEVAKEKLGDLHKSIADCAKHDQLAGVQERLRFMEEFVTKLDDSDKYTKEVEAAKCDSITREVVAGNARGQSEESKMLIRDTPSNSIDSQLED